MRVSSTWKVPFFLSVVISLVATLVVVLFLNFSLPVGLILTAVCVLIFFLTFFILRSWIRRFIYHQIEPIYRIIRNVGSSKADLQSEYLSGGNEELIKEAAGWADNKKNELDHLAEREKYRKEFIGNVSHELKTPIFNIQGYILTLLEGGIDDPAINRLYLERTEKSINRMISIVEDLESIGRLESGMLRLQHEPFNIVEVVEEVYENQEFRASERGIKLSVKKPRNRPVLVYADKIRIFEALNNLVSNTIIYGRQNGKTSVRVTEKRDTVLVEVEDNGIGISEKEIPRIFERFYRVDKSRSRNMGGTGLGLAIVKHIVEAHNQTIHVRSKPGEGSVFGFTLKKA